MDNEKSNKEERMIFEGCVQEIEQKIAESEHLLQKVGASIKKQKELVNSLVYLYQKGRPPVNHIGNDYY